MLNRLIENTRNAKGQRQTGIVSLRLDRIDRLARHVETLSEFLLRPVTFSAQHAQSVFHRYFHSDRANPTTHSSAIMGMKTSSSSFTSPMYAINA